MSLDTRWFPGDELTFVWDGGILMLHAPDAESAVADRIWAGLAGNLTLGGVLQLLTDVLDASLLSLPDFAVALYEGAAGQFAARGRFEVQVGRSDGPVWVVGAGVTTWSERAVDGIVSVTVGLATDAGQPGLPLRVGVVPASRVVWGAPAALVVEEPDGLPATVSEDPPSVPEEASAVATLGAAPDPEETPVAYVPAASVGNVTTVVSSDHDGDLAAPRRAEIAAAPEPEPAPEPAPVPADKSRFAVMWGDTVAHSIEDAAVRLDEEEPVKVPATTSALEVPPHDPSPASFVPDPYGEPLLISSVPGRTASAPATRHATPDAWSDHDGATVVGFSLATPALVPTSQAADPEKVLALVCLSGHANRPHRTQCKDCGANLTGAVTETVTRPPLGTIRSTTGEVLALTGPVLIGRSPRAARFQGTVSPQLLSLPYPHISSTHLEIRLEGWNAFAVDLNSMNGAYLRRHDEPPVRITHSPLMLADDDVIDFGHGVSVSFEGMP